MREDVLASQGRLQSLHGWLDPKSEPGDVWLFPLGVLGIPMAFDGSFSAEQQRRVLSSAS